MKKSPIVLAFFVLLFTLFVTGLMAQEGADVLEEPAIAALPMMQSLSMEGLPEDKLDVISAMIVEGKPESDILREWKSALSLNDKMDVSSAVIYITQKSTMLWHSQNQTFTGETGAGGMTQDNMSAINSFTQKMSKIVQEMVNVAVNR